MVTSINAYVVSRKKPPGHDQRILVGFSTVAHFRIHSRTTQLPSLREETEKIPAHLRDGGEIPPAFPLSTCGSRADVQNAFGECDRATSR
jgi:hypothetical protein